MNKQQKRKNQKINYDKFFMESFKPLDEGGRAKVPTARSTPIIDKIMHKKLKRTK